MSTFQFKRGTESGIPTLADGQPGWTTDTHRLFVGQGGTNYEVGGGGGSGLPDTSGVPDGSVVMFDGFLTTEWVSLIELIAHNGAGATPVAGKSLQSNGLGGVTWGDAQPLDATLTALAGVTTAADTLVYATGSDTFTTTSLTAAGRSRVAYVQSTITADPTDPTTDTHYLCDPSSASFTVTLPAASTFGAGRRLRFTLIGSTGSPLGRTVTIDRASGDYIDIQRVDFGGAIVLYERGDTVEIESDGVSGWLVVQDGRILHAAQMVRTTAQTLSHNTTTKIQLNSAVANRGGIGSTSNNRVVIRRPGIYDCRLQSWTAEGMSSGEYIVGHLYKNGSLVWLGLANVGPTANACVQQDYTLSLAKDDYIEMYLLVSHPGGMNTPTGVDRRPTLTVQER